MIKKPCTAVGIPREIIGIEGDLVEAAVGSAVPVHVEKITGCLRAVLEHFNDWCNEVPRSDSIVTDIS